MNVFPPLQPCNEGHLSPSVHWQEWALPHPVPNDFGQWMNAHKLHARGTDYSSSSVRFGQNVSSFIKRLWDGRLPPDPAYSGTRVWVLSADRPIGVAVWETPTDPNASLGRLNIWMDPMFRKRGLMGDLLATQVCPAIESLNSSASLLAATATAAVVQSCSNIACRELVVYRDDFPSPPVKRQRF